MSVYCAELLQMARHLLQLSKITFSLFFFYSILYIIFMATDSILIGTDKHIPFVIVNPIQLRKNSGQLTAVDNILARNEFYLD